MFKLIRSVLIVIVIAVAATRATADVHPQGVNLNYSPKALSIFSNPAGPALIIERDDSHVLSEGMFNISASGPCMLS